MAKDISWKFYFGQVWYYLKQHKLLFGAGFLAMLAASGSQLLHPLILAHIIDKSIPNKDFTDMLLYGGFFVGAIVLNGFFTYLQTNLLARLGLKIITQFKRNVFQHLLKAPISYFSTHPVGELVAKVESDSERVRELFSSLSVSILGNILFFGGVYAVLMVKNSRITLILTPIILLVAVGFGLLLKHLTKLFKRNRELNAEITSKVTDYVQGMSLIQVFNQQSKIYGKLYASSENKRNVDIKTSIYSYGAVQLAVFVLSVVVVVMVIRLSAAQIITGTMTIGTLFLFIQYINKLTSPLLILSYSATALQSSFVSLRRILDLHAIETEDKLFSGTDAPCFNQEIRFEHVWFAYNAEEWVLKDVSFTIPKGGKVALVGPSGSGKSTVVSLLCSFYMPQKGCIYVDGIPLGSIDLYAWRQQIGLILQEIILFPGNVMENIRIYNDDISPDQVSKAIDIVQLRDFITAQQMGMETNLAERGQNISQGEKQLISFARAIVYEPDIIVMDEATASIDQHTEARIQETITRVMNNKTAVVVAHRLSSVIDADEILYFKDGQIVHRGTHAQMLEISKDYKHMFTLQTDNCRTEGQ